MKILIDIGHPGHVHLFKNFAFEMQKQNHIIHFTCRQKEFEEELLQAYHFKYTSFGPKFPTKLGKIWGLFKFDARELFTAIKFKPDLFLSHGSMYAAHAAFMMRKPHISMEDSGNMEQIRIYRPFTKSILTPDVLPEQLGPKQIKYKAYHELAYLHPNYFTPDASVIKELGINPNEKYCILRFVSWRATHDVGHKGFSAEQKTEMVHELSKHLKVFITSEAILPDELKPYHIRIHPARLHDVLAFAEIVISEGATIASESGVLGIPTLYVNSISRSYNEDQENYGTVLNFRSGEGVLEKALELLALPDLKEKWQHNRQKLLEDKIDLTGFLIWFVENFPQSHQIMKINPDYQFRFRV